MNQEKVDALVEELLDRTNRLLDFLKDGNLLALETELQDREVLVVQMQQLDREGAVFNRQAVHELNVLNQELLDQVLEKKMEIRDNVISIKKSHKVTKAYDSKPGQSSS